jgi:radical SAM superfamily enzyme YgiQ (UPF0313 family)
MLVLVNTNRMTPPIGPIGLDYVACAARDAALDVRVADLCLAPDRAAALDDAFAGAEARLVGLSFRNVDDSFWPSGTSFLPVLAETIEAVRERSSAPIVLGGVGLSIFAERILRETGVEFAVCGDGEKAIVALHAALEGSKDLSGVPGLIWRDGETIHANRPAWESDLSLPTRRDAIDNATYFRLGGQGGVETKRGCPRPCIYCADPLAKGTVVRPRDPREIANEIESLAAQGVDVLHTCDGEFNVPGAHAKAVCEELIRRGIGERVRWYAYLAVVPFDDELAGTMRRAGCVGVNFTGDSACDSVLSVYRKAHRRDDLRKVVGLCRKHDLAVMVDLLLGGPGETPETLGDSIEFFKRLGPDCVGAALGMRLYPGTAAPEVLLQEGPLEDNPGLRRRYEGPVDLLYPTFYISPALGPNPARTVKELVAGDERFFEPQEESDAASVEDPSSDYNYNDNDPLVRAIADGARGAYWDILRRMRSEGGVWQPSMDA